MQRVSASLQVLTFLRTDVKRIGDTSATTVAILPSKLQQQLKALQIYTPANLGGCIHRLFKGAWEHQATFLKPGSDLLFVPSRRNHTETTYSRCVAIPRESFSMCTLQQVDVGMSSITIYTWGLNTDTVRLQPQGIDAPQLKVTQIAWMTFNKVKEICYIQLSFKQLYSICCVAHNSIIHTAGHGQSSSGQYHHQSSKLTTW